MAALFYCVFLYFSFLSSAVFNIYVFVAEPITLAFKEMTSKQYFEDGIALKRRAAAFRTEFKDALMCANASGFGHTLSVAGRPRAGCHLSSSSLGANCGIPDWEVIY